MLLHTQHQIQDKILALSSFAAQAGFNIHPKKTQTLKIHAVSKEPVTLNGGPLEEADTSAYLASIINQQGGTDVDVKTRIGADFTRLKNIWKSQSHLLQGWYFQLVVELKRLAHPTGWPSCLQKILRVHWPDAISDGKIWKRTNQLQVDRRPEKEDEGR